MGAARRHAYRSVGSKQQERVSSNARLVLHRRDWRQDANRHGAGRSLSSLLAVVAGTTTGMLIANVPAVFLGDALSGKLPIRKMNYVASTVFRVLGIVFIVRGLV